MTAVVRKVYGSYNSLIVGSLKDVLERHGIRCLIRNEHLQGAAGELPPIECWPEIWVLEDETYERAREILQATLGGEADPGPSWTCPGCGESIEGQFSACWSCGAARPFEDGG